MILNTPSPLVRGAARCALLAFVDSNATQGVLRCWVDIMSLGDAKGFGADDVALPPPVEFEVNESPGYSRVRKTCVHVSLACKASAVRQELVTWNPHALRPGFGPKVLSIYLLRM